MSSVNEPREGERPSCAAACLTQVVTLVVIVALFLSLGRLITDLDLPPQQTSALLLLGAVFIFFLQREVMRGLARFVPFTRRGRRYVSRLYRRPPPPPP